jgi:hypothetical protein
MISWCYFKPDCSNIEHISNVVTVGRKSFTRHKSSHVPSGVIFTGNWSQITTRRDAVVIVIAVRNQYGVQTGNILRRNWHLDHYRHIEPSKKGIDHESCAAAIDEESGHAQPSQGCTVRSFKGFFTETSVCGAFA